MIVTTFDPSLTATGWARNLDSVPALGPCWNSGVIKSKHAGAKRLWDILNQTVRIAKGSNLVVIEGYAHGAQYQCHQMGELGGVLRLGFLQHTLPLVVVPPVKLKQFATGSGGGKKEKIYAEGIRRLGYQGHSNDEVDAIWILQMALHHYGLPGMVDLPKAWALHTESIEWPHITTHG